MSTSPYKTNRRCQSCEWITRTRAKKQWKCIKCGHWNPIIPTKAIKSGKKERYMATGMDQYVEKKKIQG